MTDMSAMISHDGDGVDVERRRRRTDVPYLRLVPAISTADVVIEHCRPSFASTRPAVMHHHHHHPPVRLTRRGRIVLWLLILAVLMGLTWLAPR